MVKIGIGITTYNRPDAFAVSHREILKYAPEGSKIVVIDDASRIDYAKADYRQTENKGAAACKNKCFELLDDCDHIFLFDDDCYPITENWWQPYVNGKQPHYNFTFKYRKDEINGEMVSDNPNGCMMYYSREVLDKVGGFDVTFGKYGYWHGSMSCRIYNAGLTSFPFMDVPNSESLFCSMDKEGTVKTSRHDQHKHLPFAKDKYMRSLGSSEYIPYKEGEKRIKVWYSNPWSSDKNIGKALNDFCATVPNEDWICLQDGDMMFLTPDWGKQIEDVVRLHGSKYALFGATTNRLGRTTQRYKGEFSNNHDVKYHAEVAKDLANNHWGEVSQADMIAGMVMLFPKTLWNKVKFKENTAAFDDDFSKDIKRKGYKMAVMKGLYVYHLYRIWSDKPIGDKTHLL
jgi:glycosyltransferase involved in cell wall biosynthesis